MLQADPAQLRWLAHQFSAASDEIRRKAMAVERVSDDVTGGTSGWKGEAAQGFARRAEFLANEVRESVQDFATISDALQTLAHRVELIQGKQQHLQNLQHQRSHLHFGLDLQVDAEIAWLDGQIWALEAEISADRLYADMAATTAFRGVQIREAFEEVWESVKQAAPGVLAKIKDELGDIKDTAIEGVKEVAKDVGDFAEGFAATYLQNASMGLADPLHEDNPEARSDWYKAGRIAGDVAATVQGAAEMIIGGGEVAAGGAEAIVASPTVVLSAVGVGAAVAGGSAVAHGWTTLNEAAGQLKGDWSLFKKKGSSQNVGELPIDPNATNGSEVQPKYSSYEDRIKRTPINKGEWKGDRGESEYRSDKPQVKDYLEEAGVDGVQYKNAMPDFSPFTKGEVKISNMSIDRRKNFASADAEIAKQWSTPDRRLTADDIAEWREDNGYTWHELNDTETMQLVPSNINSTYTHLGGVGELKIKEKGGDK